MNLPRILSLILLLLIFYLVNTKVILADNDRSLGQQLYLKNCAGCHIPIPAQVLPTESWQDILSNTQNHYGQALPTSVRVTGGLIWTYLKQDSRPAIPGETLPQYVANSRYFKALHPQVELPMPINHQSCTTCHPSAAKLDYRSLSPQWQ